MKFHKFEHARSQWIQGDPPTASMATVVSRFVMRDRAAALALAFGLVLVLACPARAVVIGFSNPQPAVMVNESVSMIVSIDPGEGGPDSLFSYGISVMGAWETLDIVPLDVDVPAALDFNGVSGPGALIGLGDAFIGVKGTVDLSANPIEMYAGTVLADFQFRFLEPGFYELRLDFFNTLGPTEDIFVSGNGVAIDDQIAFGSAIVHVVIPEPHIPALLLAGAVGLLVRRGRAA